MSKRYPYEVYVKGHPFEPALTFFSNKKAAVSFIKEDRKEPCYVLDTKTGQSIYVLYSSRCQFCHKDLAGNKVCGSCGALHVVKGLKHSPYFTMDQVAELIGVDKWDSYDDFYIENNYCQCSEELQDKGECECGFESERSDLYNKYLNAVENIAEHLLGEHGLTLIKNEKKTWLYKIMPVIGWKDSANKIRETINGVGYFFFQDTKEFLGSGPYTAREATLSHMHYLKRWYEVYGDTNAQSRLERALRY